MQIYPPGVDPSSGEIQTSQRGNGLPGKDSHQTSSVRIIAPSSQNGSSESDISTLSAARQARSSIGDAKTSGNKAASNIAVVDTPTATATPLPTNTPAPTATPTNSGPPPTPYIEVVNTNGLATLVDLRTGPGFDYPAVAKLGAGIPIAIDGRNPEGTWYRICCINGGSFWVAGHDPIRIANPVHEVALFVPDLPPTPTPTPTFTSTPPPFDRAIGPEYFPTNNEFLSIWAKIFVGDPQNEEPLAGYRLAVEFEDGETGSVERRSNVSGMDASIDTYMVSAAEGAGNRVFFNYKYEYRPGAPTGDLTSLDMLGAGTWRIWLTNSEGANLSEPVSFTLDPGNPNREIYVGWIRMR